jgi:hypothetical protein
VERLIAREVDGRGPTLADANELGGGDTLELAPAPEVALELGEHPSMSEEHLPGDARRTSA